MRSDTPFGLVDESKESLCGRETDRETCVAPRHVDVLRDFYFIFSERTRAAWAGGWRGGGGVGGGVVALPDFLVRSLFPVQQTTSGIGHRVMKYRSFSGWQPILR